MKILANLGILLAPFIPVSRDVRGWDRGVRMTEEGCLPPTLAVRCISWGKKRGESVYRYAPHSSFWCNRSFAVVQLATEAGSSHLSLSPSFLPFNPLSPPLFIPFLPAHRCNLWTGSGRRRDRGEGRRGRIR